MVWSVWKFLQVHNLSGPIRVLDMGGILAKPDVHLVVEICNLGSLPGVARAFTAAFDRENTGGGFLTGHLPY